MDPQVYSLQRIRRLELDLLERDAEIRGLRERLWGAQETLAEERGDWNNQRVGVNGQEHKVHTEVTGELANGIPAPFRLGQQVKIVDHSPAHNHMIGNVVHNPDGDGRVGVSLRGAQFTFPAANLESID